MKNNLRLFFLLSYSVIIAQTPQPPIGYEWVIEDTMSDEFNNQSTLNTTKWHSRLPNWAGRKPAEFLPENVHFDQTNGYLLLRNTIHPNEIIKMSQAGYSEPDYRGNFDDLEFTIAAAGIETKETQKYGYFETKMQASNMRMSSTFWLNTTTIFFNNDVNNPNRDQGCDGFATELDIVETMGGGTPDFAAIPWTRAMNSNTHFKLKRFADGTTNCFSEFQSEGSKHDTNINVADDFHTYGAWWVNANLIYYYFDGALVGSVNPNDTSFGIPLSVPMSLRCVTETYNWQIKRNSSGDWIADNPGYPTQLELQDNSINATKYDYVRTYSLKPSIENLIDNPDFETGSMDTWEASNQPGGGVNITNTANSKFSGEYGIQMNGQSYLKQIVSVTPDSDYELNVTARKNTTSAPVIFGVKSSTGDVIISDNVNTNTFSNFKIDFNSASDTEIEIYAFAKTNETLFLDNFSLIETPVTLNISSLDTKSNTNRIFTKDKELFIYSSIDNQMRNIEIYNMLGRIVYKNKNYNVKTNSTDKGISLSKLSSGVYIVKLISKNGSFEIFKIII